MARLKKEDRRCAGDFGSLGPAGSHPAFFHPTQKQWDAPLRGRPKRCPLKDSAAEPLDLARLGSLGTLGHLEFHSLPLGQGLESGALDRRVMNEDVGTVFLGDETVALSVIEPLDRASGHLVAFLFPGARLTHPKHCTALALPG